MKVSLFQGVLLGVFIFGGLIGLFVFATYSGKGTGTTTVGPVVVWGTLAGDDVSAALSASAKTDQSLKGITYIQKNGETLQTDLATAIATGAAPDMLLVSQEDLQPLTKFISPIPLSSLPTSALTNAFIEEGNLFAAPSGAGYYGIPYLVDTLVLFSNRSILSSAGIAKPPATWEALVGLVPNIAVLTPSRQITRGLIALGTYDNVQNARAILSALFLQQGVPLSVPTANGSLSASLGLNSSGGATPGPAVLGFYTQFADPSKVSYTWNASLQNSRQKFLAGDLALYIGYASEARFLRAANPNLDFVVTPLPQPATAQFKSTYGLVYGFVFPRGGKNSAGAYQAAVLLTNSAEQAAAAAATSLAPASLTPLATVPADPVSAVSYAEALYAAGWLSPTPANTDNVFSSMIGNVISGRSNLQTSLVTAERSLGALLQQ